MRTIKHELLASFFFITFVIVLSPGPALAHRDNIVRSRNYFTP